MDLQSLICTATAVIIPSSTAIKACLESHESQVSGETYFSTEYDTP